MQNIKSGKEMNKSAGIVKVIMTVVAVVLLFRILYMQTCDYKRYEEKVINQLTTGSTITADRGKIYDRNGIVLATSITTYRVFISPSAIASAIETGTAYDEMIADGLSDILGVERSFVLEQIGYTNKLDRTIAREVSEELTEQVWAFVKENGISKMVYTEATGTRYYPYGELASHVIGTVGSGYGLESQYNGYLAGTDGKYVTARDASGKEMPYEYDSYIPAEDGNNLITTLDLYVQSALEEQVELAYTEHGGKNRAVGIVMEVDTGAILGMSVYPSYDLNNPRELDYQSVTELADEAFELGYSEGTEDYNNLKTQKILEMWSNKAITEPYMPGSTFKIVTASMAYEEDLVDANETLTCEGYYKVADRIIHCHNRKGHGTLTFEQGIQQSCNPWLMKMGLRVGGQAFYDYFVNYGYTRKTGVDIPGEVSAESLFWSEEDFVNSELNLAVASFGQNFKVTAIQQITAIAAVANGGYLVTPHLVEKVTDTNGSTVMTYDTASKRQVVSTSTCRKISQILEDGVAGDGGAKNAYVAGYRVAAKTGTSEKKDEGDGKYVCSCVGYAPADNPKYIALILVDEPTTGVLYGSVVAAPYISNLLETILPYLGVEAEYTDAELEKMAIETPSVTYWTPSAAEKFADNLGFDVEFRGDGKYVVGQSPAAGVKVEKSNAKLILYLDNKTEQKEVTVPDLSGQAAVAANEILANRNLNIRISGTSNYLSGSKAKVMFQSPAAGEKVPEGTVVTVTFANPDDEEPDIWDID